MAQRRLCIRAVTPPPPPPASVRDDATKREQLSSPVHQYTTMQSVRSIVSGDLSYWIPWPASGHPRSIAQAVPQIIVRPMHPSARSSSCPERPSAIAEASE